MKNIIFLVFVFGVQNSFGTIPIPDIITAPKQSEVTDFRLPTTVTPFSYVIELTPYFDDATGQNENFTFDGTATIKLELQTEMTISIHMNELDVHSTILTQAGSGAEIELTEPNCNEVTNICVYQIDADFTNSNVTLEIKYTGIIRSAMNGFYRSSYVQDGVTKWLGSTQFQSTSARYAFPCFDEPGFKSTFQIIINRLPKYVGTYSNTKLESRTFLSDGRVRDTFKVTPIMSSYLVAFVVSEFVSRDNIDETHGVFARLEASQQTKYGQQYGIDSLNMLDDWTNIPYYSVDGIEKLDHGAIPDFAAGAMENWGLILYRETALLYDPLESNVIAQQRVATVITHEQAHLWFGDLVTCSWWGWVWLNEGFATYFQYFGTALVETDWELDKQFVVEQLQVVFEFDSLENSHPMTVQTETLSDLSYVGDSTAYNKACSVLRMIEHVMGKEKFQSAVRKYLQRYRLQAVEPEDLFEFLQDEAPELPSLESMLIGWTTQAGYPLITVELSENRREFTVKQERFLLKNMTHNTDLTKWDIPINLVASHELSSDFQYDNTAFSSIFTSNMDTHIIEHNIEIDFAIFNIQQKGYYRVNYDDASWEKIGNYLKSSHQNVDVLNRAQIVDDVMNIARAGLIDYELAFSVFDYLRHEENAIPWRSAFNAWSYIMRRFTGDQLERARNFIIRLTENLYGNVLTYDEQDDDTRIDQINRINLLTYLCKYGHSECVQRSNEEFQKFRTNQYYRVRPNLRPAVYCTGMTNANQADWDFLWDVYRNANVAAEQTVILTALGCTKNSQILTNYFNKILTEDVRELDKSAAFTATYTGYEENVDVIFNYIIDNHQTLEYGGLPGILAGVAARLTTQEQIDKLKQFKNTAYPTSTQLERAIEDAEFNLDWANTHMETIYEVINSGTIIKSITFLVILSILINKIFS